MKKFGLLVVGVIGVLSANVPLDSVADSTISVDSHIDSSNVIPPPQKQAR